MAQPLREEKFVPAHKCKPRGAYFVGASWHWHVVACAGCFGSRRPVALHIRSSPMRKRRPASLALISDAGNADE